MKKYHFISGLPRSGSTLLVSILNQNPKFFAEITNPLFNCINNIDKFPGEQSTMMPESRRINVARGIFDGFYAHVNKEVIFNTHRFWTQRIDLVNQLYPNSKFICCVRDIPEIINSFELLYRRRGFYPQKLFKRKNTTVYQRADELMHRNVIGKPYAYLKEAYYGPMNDNLYLIEYKCLVADPELVIKTLYDFIQEPYYKHNFKNLSASHDEFDETIGLPNAHKVDKTIKVKKKINVLPPDLRMKYANLEFWRV